TEPAISSTTATVEVVQPPRAVPAQKPRTPGDDTTREMPRIKATAPPPRPAPTPARAAPSPARTAPAPAPTPPAAKRTDGAKAPARAAVAPPPRPAAAAAAKSTSVSADLRGKIITDAIRLLKWGKSWHELPE